MAAQLVWNLFTLQWPAWRPSSNFYDKVTSGVGSLYAGASPSSGGYDKTATSADDAVHPSGSHSKSNKKIVMVTGSTGNNRMLGMPHIKEMVYENRMTYAEKHGLEFMWANMTSYNLPNGAPIYWNKIPILKDAFARFPDAEWVWWMDLDVIIMNMSLSIHDHVLSPEGMARNILLDHPMTGAGGGETGYRSPAAYHPDNINFVISLDNWGMNVGNFLMRRSEWSDWLLDLWIEPLYISQNWVFPENDGWTHMWQYHEIVQNHTACMKQQSMNSYPDYNFLGQHWQPGDHIVHFAGCGGDAICESAWAKYWNMREKVDVPPSVKGKLDDGTAEIEAFQSSV